MSRAKNSATLSARLREAREACGLTLKELSEASGYAPSTISEVEHGAHSPGERYLRDMILALGLNPSWLFAGECEMFDTTKGSEALLRQSMGMLRVKYQDIEQEVDKLRQNLRFLGDLIADVEKLVNKKITVVGPQKYVRGTDKPPA